MAPARPNYLIYTHSFSLCFSHIRLKRLRWVHQLNSLEVNKFELSQNNTLFLFCAPTTTKLLLWLLASFAGNFLNKSIFKGRNRFFFLSLTLPLSFKTWEMGSKYLPLGKRKHDFHLINIILCAKPIDFSLYLFDSSFHLKWIPG